MNGGGGAFVLGGAFQIIASIFHPDNNDPNAVPAPFWVPVQLGLLVFYALSFIGLLGLNRYQGQQAGKLGLIGLILALIGSAFTVVTSIGFAFVLPAFAAQQSTPKALFALLDPTGPLAWLSLITLTYLIFFVPGYILTGIATMRARLLPRWAINRGRDLCKHH